MSDELPLTCVAPGNRRPGTDDAMRLQAAREIAGELVRCGIVGEAEAEGSARDIFKATRNGERDGFRIARELERGCSWDCDMETAEALDGFGSALDAIHSAAEKKWAAENPALPTFSAGDTVIWRGEPATVRGEYEHRPQCYRISQGLACSEGSYYVVPYEDALPAPGRSPQGPASAAVVPA